MAPRFPLFGIQALYSPHPLSGGRTCKYGDVSPLSLFTIIWQRWENFTDVIKVLNQLTFGEGNGNPLQYYCLENPMDRGAWQAAVYGVTKSWTRLSEFTLLHWREAGRANGEWGACSVLGRPLRVLLCYRSFQYFWASLRVLFSPYCFLNPLLPQLQNK